MINLVRINVFHRNRIEQKTHAALWRRVRLCVPFLWWNIRFKLVNGSMKNQNKQTNWKMESQRRHCLMLRNLNTFSLLWWRDRVASVLGVPTRSINPDGNINLFDQMCENVTLKGGSSMLNRHISSQKLLCNRIYQISNSPVEPQSFWIIKSVGFQSLKRLWASGILKVSFYRGGSRGLESGHMSAELLYLCVARLRIDSGPRITQPGFHAMSNWPHFHIFSVLHSTVKYWAPTVWQALSQTWGEQLWKDKQNFCFWGSF